MFAQEARNVSNALASEQVIDLRDRMHGPRRSFDGQFPTTSAVIPTLNEERNIPVVLERMPDCVTEIVLVDGLSTDRTIDAAREVRPDVRIVTETKKGKGAALAAGFREATGDVIVMLDADGSTKPEEIPRFLDALVAGADFVKGSRFADGGGSADFTRLRRVGNKGFATAVNLLWG